MSQILRRCISYTPNRAAKAAASNLNPHAANANYLFWKRLTFFVGVPAIGLCMVNAYLKHQEEHHHPRPEFVKYDYLCKREKPFPWGDGNKSLFHNPKVNFLPDGYET